MSEPALKPDEKFTYGQYKTWPEDERWELIDGTAYAMNTPSHAHQWILKRLAFKMETFLEGKPCILNFAPFDTLLREGEEELDEIRTVVQPDIVVFCDRSKLRRFGAVGAPDLAVEILSPSSLRHDFVRKLELYARYKVREYWLAEPDAWWIRQFVLDEKGRYGDEILFDNSGILKSAALSGFELDVRALFAESAWIKDLSNDPF